MKRFHLLFLLTVLSWGLSHDLSSAETTKGTAKKEKILSRIKEIKIDDLKKNPTFDSVKEIISLLKIFDDLKPDDQVTSDEYNLMCQFFTDKKVEALIAWGKKFAPGWTYLSDCSVSLARNYDQEFKGSKDDICTKKLPDGKIETKNYAVKYGHRIVKGSEFDYLKLIMPFSTNYDPDVTEEEKKSFKEKWDKALLCAKSFWSRYAVNLIFIEDKKATAQFTVHKGSLRGDCENYYLTSYNSIYFCSWIIHEFGHWMGLKDDYIEPGYTCPGRDPSKKDSVMNENAISDPSLLRFYPKQLEEIFGKACGPYKE